MQAEVSKSFRRASKSGRRSFIKEKEFDARATDKTKTKKGGPAARDSIE